MGRGPRHVPEARVGRGGRPEEYCHRDILDAIRFVVDNGVKWPALPADLPAVEGGAPVLHPLAEAGADRRVPRPAPRRDA
ncbi:transposase [Streptomyces sp. NPDC054775]